MNKGKFFNTLFSTKSFEHNSLIEDIGMYLAEHIKSHMRKTGKFNIQLNQLEQMIIREFDHGVNNKELLTIIADVRMRLFNKKIAIFADNSKLVAGYPLSKEKM